MPKTFREIEDLKAQWLADPCWDLEDTEGFEDSRTQLKIYRELIETGYKVREQERLEKKAQELGCNVTLVKYIEALEWRITTLENRAADY